MATTKTVFLNLESGQYMSWLISTQAAYASNTVLKDDKQVYFNYDNKPSDAQVICGQGKITGANLRLEVTIPKATTILMAESTGELVTSPDGEVVGYTRAYAFEDGGDSDFSDVMVSIITHKKN